MYFPNLNSLRFYAALSVIIAHVLGFHVIDGHFGVVLFFVLSGFLITYFLFAEKNKSNTISLRKFYLKRILRIWPLYFLILIITFYIQFTIDGNNSKLEESWFYYVFFLPNVAYILDLGSDLVGILWSIGSEEQFYIIWPVLLLLSPKKYFIHLIVGIILFYLLAPIFFSYINANFYNSQNNTLEFLPKLLYRMAFQCFAIGALFAYLFTFKGKLLPIFYSKFTQIITLLFIIVFWFLDLPLFTFSSFNPDYLNDLCFAFIFGILILNLSTNEKSIISIDFKPTNYLGKISYGLYVFHPIAIYLFHQFSLKFEIHFMKGLELVSILLITIIFSALSYHFIETPFLKLKEKYT